MKNLVIEKLNNFIGSEIDKICNEYEQKIQQLEQQNKRLLQEVEQYRQQLLVLESNNINNKVNVRLEPERLLLEKKERKRTFSTEEIEALNLNALSSDRFLQLVKQFNDLIFESNDENIVKAILKKYSDIAVKSRRNHITKALNADNNRLANYLITDPNCIIEKLQLLSKLKLTAYAKQFIENLLTIHLSLLKDTHSAEQLSRLFWYAFLYDYQDLYLKSFNTVVTSANPLTSIYFKPVNQKLEKKYAKEVRNLLNSLGIFKTVDCDIIKSKLIRKNIIFSPGSNQMPLPTIQTIFVIREMDKSTFIQNFSLKREKIFINLVNTANNKSKKMIEAFVDVKHSKAYITDKQYEAYLNQFSPYRPKISDYYYNFKWPSTEIVNNAAIEATTLQKVSDLKSMGYSYILRGNKRWAILCNAVNEIGLKKVAYTLATNTKRLKGRKPKSPAIAIWEEDLARLKLEFYKNGFQWPSTKL